MSKKRISLLPKVINKKIIQWLHLKEEIKI